MEMYINDEKILCKEWRYPVPISLEAIERTERESVSRYNWQDHESANLIALIESQIQYKTLTGIKCVQYASWHTSHTCQERSFDFRIVAARAIIFPFFFVFV